jgi:hypothetical protein
MSNRRRSLTPGAATRLAQVAALAAKGLWFHRRLTLYQMIGLAAVLVPLLLIAGLKNGFIEGMLAQLRADPRNLEVIIIGNRALDSAWFQTVSGSPAAGFVIPNTRSLSATITLANDQGGTIGDVQMIPTAAGDPLLGSLPVPAADDAVILSAATARKLGVAAGDTIRAAVQRRMNGQDQASVRSLQVQGIAPENLATGDFAFVTLRLLVLSEDYRDGSVESINVPGPDEAALKTRAFASARLYARAAPDRPHARQRAGHAGGRSAGGRRLCLPRGLHRFSHSRAAGRPFDRRRRDHRRADLPPGPRAIPAAFRGDRFGRRSRRPDRRRPCPRHRTGGVSP